MTFQNSLLFLGSYGNIYVDLCIELIYLVTISRISVGYRIIAI